MTSMFLIKMVCCAAYGCYNRTDDKKSEVTFHRFPKNSERRAAWVKAVRRKNWSPSSASVLCSEHFLPEDIDRTSLCVVRIRENSVPSVFPAYPPRLQNPQLFNARTVKSSGLISLPGGSRSGSAALPVTVKSSVKRKGKRRRKTPAVQNCSDEDDGDAIECLDISGNLSPSTSLSMLSERLLMEPSVFEMLLVDENILPLPVTWGRNIPVFGPRVIMYTQLITIDEDNRIKPVFFKELCVLENGCVTCSMIGCQLKKELFWLPEGPLESCKQLEDILMRLDALEVCEGVTEEGAVECERQACFLDCLGKWRHKSCLLVPNASGTCAVCFPVISSWQSKQLIERSRYQCVDLTLD